MSAPACFVAGCWRAGEIIVSVPLNYVAMRDVWMCEPHAEVVSAPKANASQAPLVLRDGGVAW